MKHSTRKAQVFQALADPTRRAMLDLLRSGERSVTELNEPFDMSQPAISKHLAILRRAGLVQPRKVGRHCYYSLDAKPLRSVAEWVAHYERFWPTKLSALGRHLEENP